jgi:hypothetical protein
MSADNHPHMNREIQALQQEQPRPDAKAELILALLKEKRETKMSVLKKATLPTLVSIAAIAGVFYVSQPKVMAATPEKVAKAIQEIKNYTIKSFVLNGTERKLQSKTIVSGKDRKTVFYDEKGQETTSGVNADFMMLHDSPANMGFKFDVKGDLKELSKEDIEKLKINVDKIVGQKIEEISKSIVIDGKSLDKLPGNMKISGQNIKIEIVKDKDGKEVKKFFVDGKQVDKLPEGLGAGIEIKNLQGKGGGGASIIIGGKEIKPGDMKFQNSQSMAAIVGGADGKPMMMQSGGTSADYLIDLLKDTARWTIERGVTLNGQRLDKFTLKGPLSPITLYVDPANALPKVLQFATPFQEGAMIEDVYEYSVQP